MLRAAFFTVILAFGSFAGMRSFEILPNDFDAATLPHIRLLDAKSIYFDLSGEKRFAGISGLAYDEGREHLYALGDDGLLHTLELALEGKKIKRLTLLRSRMLTNKNGEPYKKSGRDSEGAVLTENGLLVSFERKPRIARFDRQGRALGRVKIDAALEDIGNYRGKNKALESVAYHPRYGVLTVPERPLRQNHEYEHVLYGGTKRWRFKAHAEVTAIETMPNGNVLVLERGFDFWSREHLIVLQEVDIGACVGDLCPSTVLARLESSGGWKLDNFEGLTRVRDDLYLMISDDNDSLFQKTVLVLFEIVRGS